MVSSWELAGWDGYTQDLERFKVVTGVASDAIAEHWLEVRMQTEEYSFPESLPPRTPLPSRPPTAGLPACLPACLLIYFEL